MKAKATSLKIDCIDLHRCIHTKQKQSENNVTFLIDYGAIGVKSKMISLSLLLAVGILLQ